MKRKIITLFILLFITLNTSSLGFYSPIPIWDFSDETLEVNTESTNSFLNLESESAILIEQNTRKNSF